MARVVRKRSRGCGSLCRKCVLRAFGRMCRSIEPYSTIKTSARAASIFTIWNAGWQGERIEPDSRSRARRSDYGRDDFRSSPAAFAKECALDDSDRPRSKAADQPAWDERDAV